MTKEKVAKIVLILSLIFLAVTMTYYYFGAKLITFGWHILHPQKLKWNGLNVVVPENLIGKYKENKLLIYQMRDPGEIMIIFSRSNSNYEPDKYRKINFKIIEENKVIVMDKESVWVKAVSGNGEFDYLEDIYFLSKPIRIAFLGKKQNRDIFEKVINDLKWE